MRAFPRSLLSPLPLSLSLSFVLAAAPRPFAAEPDLRPGARVLLDGHNAYPERGQFADRLDRVLGTGLPVAIEQDLYWARNGGAMRSVVAHDDDALDGAPTFEAYFFTRLRPLMERALADGKRDQWPLVVLNLDFKDNAPAHLDAVWQLLTQYRAWLTTAPRTASPATRAPFAVGPMLVLCGSDTAQRRRFHDDVPIGAPLLAFGAMPPVPAPGPDREARARRAVEMTAEQHIPTAANNYARWVNFPWSVIEEGGQTNAGAWTAADAVRLRSFAARAHAAGYWLRFYTLDGFAPADDRGWTAGYNFGTLAAAQQRWRAAREARVDFIATDQYEAFSAHR
jgi:hypothetical protein